MMRSLLCVLLFLLGGIGVRAGDYLVVIDPAHRGSRDAGSQAERSLSAANNATSPSGLKEKDLTLELSLEILAQVKALAAAHPGTRLECRLTRTEDINLDFIKRTELCLSARPLPLAIVSIHFNASSSAGSALGSLAVVHHQKANANYAGDHAFATGLIRAASEAVSRFVPNSRPREPISDAHLHGGAGSNFFHQLAKHRALATVPKCFLEVEFIDRPDVDKNLLQPRKTTFPVIARAIAEFLYGQCK